MSKTLSIKKPPDKIYLHDYDDDDDPDVEFEGVFWCEDRLGDRDIEYVRLDLIRYRMAAAGVSGENIERHIHEFLTGIKGL